MDYKVDIETEDSMPSWDSLWGRFLCIQRQTIWPALGPGPWSAEAIHLVFWQLPESLA